MVARPSSDHQLDLQALHRVRSRLISDRTAVINQIRCFLLERGIPVRQGLRFLRRQLPDLLATRTDVLSPRMVRIVEDLVGDWSHLDERIENVTDEIEALARDDESCRQLMTVPGVGPIIASAMVAAIGNGTALCKGATLRRGSAWYRSRCPRVIVPSLAASLNVAIAICARSSCKVPALFCSGRQTGQNTVSARG